MGICRWNGSFACTTVSTQESTRLSMVVTPWYVCVFWVVPCGACASDRVSGERSDHNIVGSEALRLQSTVQNGTLLGPPELSRQTCSRLWVLVGSRQETPHTECGSPNAQHAHQPEALPPAHTRMVENDPPGPTGGSSSAMNSMMSTPRGNIEDHWHQAVHKDV